MGHSWAIRGKRGNFGWLKTPKKADTFLPSLEKFLLSLPITIVACVIHRPGYLYRYKEKYHGKLWFMCKTAFSILIERSAKFVDTQDGAMETYFEKSGRHEDRNIIQYMRDLKTAGLSFGDAPSGKYAPLMPDDFKRLCLGLPYRRTKNTPMLQLADLVLFPVAKAGYNPHYRPYLKMKEAGKLIDCHLSAEDIPKLGIKYSCYDDLN